MVNEYRSPYRYIADVTIAVNASTAPNKLKDYKYASCHRPCGQTECR
jgi:hypothetical protein